MAKVRLVFFNLYTGYYTDFHHGLAFLIGSLRKENNSVLLSHVETESDMAEAARLIGNEKSDIIGLSFNTNQKRYVREFLQNPAVAHPLIIAGGAHPTLAGEEIFSEFPSIRGVCIGEGEAPLTELCRRIDKKEGHLDVQSIYFRGEDGIVKNPLAPLRDIDTLPYPDYSLFDCKKIVTGNGGYFSMMVSRGCPYDCSYCCNHAIRNVYPDKNKYLRAASPGHAIELIKSNLAYYPQARKIRFLDETFTMNKKWLLEFCDIYKKEVGLNFSCNCRVENIDAEVAKALKGAGCIFAYFGVESGNEWLRAHVLNRHHSNAKIEESRNLFKKHLVPVGTFNMLGLPFETPDMQKDTITLNYKLMPELGKCFYFYPYPKTRIYQLCREYGMLLEGLESRSGIHEAPCLKDIFTGNKITVKNYQALQIFFYLRSVLSRIGLPVFLQLAVIKFAVLFRVPIFMMLDPLTKNPLISGIKWALYRFQFKYLR